MAQDTTTAPPAEVLANRPCARTVRAALKAAGIARLAGRITTGRRSCHVNILWTDREDLTGQHSARRVAEALRPLWHDGDTRVSVSYGGEVTISVTHYWETVPDTPEGLAWLTHRENTRNAALLASPMGILYSSDYRRVSYQPHPDHPRRPWVTQDGSRLTPFRVFGR